MRCIEIDVQAVYEELLLQSGVRTESVQSFIWKGLEGGRSRTRPQVRTLKFVRAIVNAGAQLQEGIKTIDENFAYLAATAQADLHTSGTQTLTESARY